MRVVPIDELAKLEPDEIIPSVKGKIKSIRKRAEGTGDYGPWTLQNVELEAIAPDVGTVAVCFKDRDELDLNSKGKVVYISCTQGDRGMQGVKWKINKKSKKMEVSVTSTADVSFTESSGATTSQAAPATAAQTHEPAPKPAVTEAKKPSSGKDSPSQAVGRKAHLMFICFRAANYSLGKFAVQTGGSPQDVGFEAISSVATTLYIDAHRDGLHHELDYRIPDPEPKQPQPQQPPQ